MPQIISHERDRSGSAHDAEPEAGMSMSAHADGASGLAIDTQQSLGSPTLAPGVTDAGNPLVSPIIGGPSSSSSHDYTSAGEGLSESLHNGNFARSPVLAAIASGTLGRTGSLRSAAGKGRAGGSRSGSISNGTGHGSDGHYANGTSHFRANGAANGTGFPGPSPAAVALGLTVDDGRFKPIFEGSTVDAREYVRLTMQTLRDMGLDYAARALEQESGVTLEHPSIQAFRAAVLHGDWRNAERLLLDGLMYSASRRTSGAVSNGATTTGELNGASHTAQQAQVDSVLRYPEERGWEYIKFLLHQQRYLELLEAKKTKKALSVLRSRLAPLNYGVERLQELSSLVVCATSEELRRKAHWEGTGDASRRRLLQEIEDAVSPNVMLPSRRLPTLLQQAQTLQKHQDPFYNHPRETYLSLYTDHRSDRSNFPSRSARVLEGHTDEVWDIAFSPDGSRLASAGKDAYVIIWKASETFDIEYKLGPHADAVHCVAWSPDGEWLVATSDPDVTLWEVATGKSKRLSRHEYRVGTACWLPDGSGFVTGGEDAKVIFWNKDGTVRQTWVTSPFRLIALDISPDGKRLVAVSFRHSPAASRASQSTSTGTGYAGGHETAVSEADGRSVLGMYGADPEALLSPTASEGEHQLVVDLGGGSRTMTDERYKISFYDIERRQEIGAVYMSEEMSSVTISDDSRYALINQRPNEARLWDIEHQCMVNRYFGHHMSKCIIRSCFGGADKNFVISGSEDGIIYVYQRSSGRLLEKLEGHGEGCINAVAWHPTNVAMLASCSDDYTVRIWTPGTLPPLSSRLHSGGGGSRGGAVRSHQRQERHHMVSTSEESAAAGPTPFPWAMSPVPSSDSPAFQEVSSSSDEEEDEVMEEAL